MSAAALRPDDDRLAAAPSPALRGDIEIPGDKSLSHRALILGALAHGETRIKGLLEGQDVLETVAALRALGTRIERPAPGEWRVTGGAWRSPAAPIDCGNSGTCARLMMGAVAGFPIEVAFTGDASLRQRPMERVLGPLRRMGARVSAEAGGRLPATISGGGLTGIRYDNVEASAQVKSAILLAGLNADGAVEVVEPSPSRDHSETMLRAFGVDVSVNDNVVALGEQRALRATALHIPGDPSSAAFPLVAALIVPGSDLILRGVMINPLRTGLFETLRDMGADIKFENRRVVDGELVADLRARFGPLTGVDVPAARAPSMIDEYPILAVAAAFATGTTRMHGLAELRVKESDRIAAMVAGLRACGVEAHDEGDSLIVEGNGSPPPGSAHIAARHDHRIAMAFLVLGLASRAGVTSDSASMIATSFPGFADLMRSIGARLG